MYHTPAWRCDVKMLSTKIVLAASAALATLSATEVSFAQALQGQVAPAAQYSTSCPPGFVIDSESSGEVDGSGRCVKANPNDATVNGHELGRDPDPSVRFEIRREQDSNPD
jgi:hypothetical protein